MKKVLVVLTLTIVSLVSNAQITKHYDKYSDKTEWVSSSNNGIEIVKTMLGKDSSTIDRYVAIRVKSSHFSLSADGVVFLFEDNSKLEFGGSFDPKWLGPKQYGYLGMLIMEDANTFIEKCKTTKLKSYQVDGYIEVIISAPNKIRLQKEAIELSKK